MLPTFLKVDRSYWSIVGRARIGGSHRDPRFEILDDRIRQFSFGRHLHVFMPQCLDQKTFRSLLRHYGRTAVTTFEQSGTMIDPQSPLQNLRSRRMTLVTVFNQERAYFRLEERNLIIGELTGIVCECQRR